MRWMGYGFIVFTAFLLVSCTSGKQHYAPVMDAATIEHLPQSGAHRVLPRETLYSIAWRYGLDYRYLAARNRITPPYHIEIGQLIYLKGKATQTSKIPVTASSVVARSSVVSATQREPVVIEREPKGPVKHWVWPAKGRVIQSYSAMNKGLNISGHLGSPVFASAAGKVVYSGNGLRGYGNLIIIKHNSSFLTAYAHSSAALVREGDWVKAGQKIAKMGNSGTRRVMLHFEIRQNGKPVNPLYYLPASRF